MANFLVNRYPFKEELYVKIQEKPNKMLNVCSFSVLNKYLLRNKINYA